jgi:hypothetical protein
MSKDRPRNLAASVRHRLTDLARGRWRKSSRS